MAKGYALFQYNLRDAAKMGQYIPGAIGNIMKHGGQVLIATEDPDSREGKLATKWTVIIEFPTRAAAVGWYESPEYQAVINLRHDSTSDGSCVILDGFEPPKD